MGIALIISGHGIAARISRRSAILPYSLFARLAWSSFLGHELTAMSLYGSSQRFAVRTRAFLQQDFKPRAAPAQGPLCRAKQFIRLITRRGGTTVDPLSLLVDGGPTSVWSTQTHIGRASAAVVNVLCHQPWFLVRAGERLPQALGRLSRRAGYRRDLPVLLPALKDCAVSKCLRNVGKVSVA